MSIKIRDFESDLGEVLGEVADMVGLELVDEEEQVYQTWVEKCYIHIPKYNINIHDGYILTYNEQEKDYEMSNGIFFFFDSNSKEFVYSEQGSSLDISLYNYLNMVKKEKGITVEKIENLDCDFVVDKTFRNSFHNSQ